MQIDPEGAMLRLDDPRLDRIIGAVGHAIVTDRNALRIDLLLAVGHTLLPAAPGRKVSASIRCAGTPRS